MSDNSVKNFRRLWSVLFLINILIIAAALVLLQRTNTQIQDVNAQVISLEESEAIFEDRVVTTRELVDLYATIISAEESALGFLGVFESIAFGVSILSIVIVATGLIAAVLGFSNFSELRGELESTRRELQEQERDLSDNITQKLDSLENDLADSIQKRVENQIRKSIEQQLVGALNKNRQAWTIISLAERDLRQGNIKSALKTFKRAYEIDGDNPLPAYYLGIIALNTRQEEEARDYFKNALRIDNEFLHAEAALGFTWRRIGEKKEDEKELAECFETAENLLLKALGNDPSLVDFEGESWHGSLAGLYRRTNRTHEAKHHYRLARNVTPLSSYPAGNLARIAIKSGSNDEDINALYEDVNRLARLEISTDINNYWAQADLLTSMLVLGESEDDAFRTLRNLVDAIPELVFDVLPRVVDTIEEVNTAPSYEGDKRDKTLIETVLQRLREEIDSKQVTI